MNIRNFCIIAHIDHGKSTLADRILEYTHTSGFDLSKPQMLDSMDLERERGITIRSKTVKLNYRAKDGNDYILNLIDTPGHVDFSYEVSRAMIASEGAILLVDASQGVEAQTLANTATAKKHNLKIIPVINKIDLPTADIEGTEMQIIDILELEDDVVKVSAKSGLGIEDVLEAIVKKVPPPKGDKNSDLQAVVFDSFYDPYRGVVVYMRVFEGEIKRGMKITLLSNNKTYEVLETGTVGIKMLPTDIISSGEVGYLVAGIKTIHDVKIGDTIVEYGKSQEKKVNELLDAKPFVFAGIFPVSTSGYDELRMALEKFNLTDASLVYKNVSSSALGPGFHCGFLGSLHLEIVKERLEREFNCDILITSPNVNYKVKIKNDDKIHDIDNPAKIPSCNDIEYIEEPYVKATIVTPTEFTSNVVELCKGNRGKVIEIRQLEGFKSVMVFDMPLAEIIVGFYDALKSVSKGYASFDYEQTGYKKSVLEKLEVLINYEIVDAFSFIVHESNIDKIANRLIEKLRKTIPRQMFQIPLQVKADNRIVARDDISAIRKDVLAKCYGGDISRKRKLLEKQKEGKKKMKQFGRVEIPQETFLALLKIQD
ncbi:MAG: translation elongation factor 4 [Elusimicrobia bacterium]|nr:translation elongation factor 4 [Elusimicrobiota bacterium]MBU2615273.1 translation elongation factor 4 [Elusimicrobiota bacterium]